MSYKPVPSGLNGLTFVEDDATKDVHLVVDTKKFQLKNDQLFGISTITVTIPFDVLRDYVLKRLRDEEVAVLQGMDGQALFNYYVGLGAKNDPI